MATAMIQEKDSFLLPTLMEELYKYYNTPREGIHVSDIMAICIREQMFRRLDPKAMTTRDLNYFIIGKSSHEAAQILAKQKPERFQVEKEVWYKDIVAHVDLYDKINNIPFEMKTFRGIFETKTPGIFMKTELKEAKEFQVMQLKSYMAMLGASHGYIVELMMMNFDDPLFKEFEVSMDEKERQQMLELMDWSANAFRIAKESNAPEKAPHIANIASRNWKCKSCKYSEACLQMRNAETAVLLGSRD